MKYRFSSQAEIDINSIWLYTYEKWSFEQAERYYDQILEEIENISQKPELGRPFAHGRRNYLHRQVGSHLLFYRVGSEREIVIIRILHKRMDLEKHLGDLEEG